jgi:hypothetical protein
VNPFLAALQQALAPPQPPPRPQGLGTQWSSGVPEWSNAPIPQSIPGQGGQYLFPSNAPATLVDPGGVSARSWDLGRAKAGVTVPSGQRPQILTPEMIMLLLSSETLR